ncbi:hypothetical protein NPIL_247411, partial [Nephila pilipes]
CNTSEDFCWHIPGSEQSQHNATTSLESLFSEGHKGTEKTLIASCADSVNATSFLQSALNLRKKQFSFAREQAVIKKTHLIKSVCSTPSK